MFWYEKGALVLQHNAIFDPRHRITLAPLVSNLSTWQSRRGHSWESKHPLPTCKCQLMINSSHPSVNHVWIQLAKTGLFKAL